MTKVTFETAAIADSIKRAETIAPTKGNAYDKAAGILLEISPADQAVVLRSTNLDVYYLEWLDSIESEGDHVLWRLPAAVTAAFLKSLPIGTGKTVTFTQVGNAIEFTSGRTKAKLLMMKAEDYPTWQPFDEDGMVAVKDLGTRLSQVEWAASRGDTKLGVHFNGNSIMATDGFRLAVAPMEVPGGLESGVTIPPATLSTVLKPMGEAKIRIEGSHMLLMPDDHTQLRAILLGEKYPPVERIMVRERPQSIKFRKQALLDIINRALIVSSDRSPRLRLIIGQEEIAAFISEPDRGHVGDVLGMPGQCLHSRVEIHFTPSFLVDAVTNSPSDEVIMAYDVSDPKRGKIYIDGGSGYEVWVAPLGDARPEDQTGDAK